MVGPNRVWLKHEDVPGLAMSRSIGDNVAHTVGVTAVPVVREYFLKEDDTICIIASDGVWEFMSNKEVAEIAYSYYESG
jgi:serine/threonine protein phosphatase PrpC